MKIIDFIRKNKGFLASLVVLFAVRWSFADQYSVPSGSMEPTIQIGDHIAVNKMAYDLKIPFTNQVLTSLAEPQRGDIVVFIWHGDHETTFVKRLIGLPGDHLHIENGFVSVNGHPISGSELGRNTLEALGNNRSSLSLTGAADNLAAETIQYQETQGDHTYSVQRLPLRALQIPAEALDIDVPPGQYFFMGDNRDNSSDSRVWGFAPRSALKGKVITALWNLEKVSHTF